MVQSLLRDEMSMGANTRCQLGQEGLIWNVSRPQALLILNHAQKKDIKHHHILSVQHRDLYVWH